MIPWREKSKLLIQRVISFGFYIFILYPLAFLFISVYRGYRIIGLKDLRQEYKKIRKQIQGPLLICVNHFTFLDPFLVSLALRSFWDYVFHFQTFAWNIPKKSYARSNKFFQFIFYIGKTVPIDREGSDDEIKMTMQKIKYLLKKGQDVLIFPEGTRSKMNKIDRENFSYGVGNLLRQADYPAVLCVYLRGQANASCNFPVKKEQFFCDLKLIHPKTSFSGLRADKDLATQIIQTLVQMENSHLSSLASGK